MSFIFPGRHSVRLSYNGHLVGILNIQDDALARAMLDRKALKTAGLVDDLNEIENVRFALRHQALDEPYYESRPKGVRIRALTGGYTKDTIAIEAAVLTFEPLLVCSICRAAVGSCEHTATWGPLLRENVWADLSNQFDPNTPIRVVIGDQAFDTTLGQIKVSPATYDPNEKVVIQDGGSTFEMTRRELAAGPKPRVLALDDLLPSWDETVQYVQDVSDKAQKWRSFDHAVGPDKTVTSTFLRFEPPDLPPEELKAWMDRVCAAIDEWRAHPKYPPLITIAGEPKSTLREAGAASAQAWPGTVDGQFKSAVEDVGELAAAINRGKGDVPTELGDVLITFASLAVKLGLDPDACLALAKAKIDKKLAEQLPKTRGCCNKHDDCDAADAEARANGKARATHCHDEDCEDCFGS